eukprot:TRINITY_DN25353_c2_g1_i1.p1 TRINITY_DN25353_c2_g1~~TRINITY_DN25353_c2_g1_i1.p1  ORF type:complete len:402 (+),score=71.35 TRINITY_DN25353_c2_g1_i1:123-1328(+)
MEDSVGQVNECELECEGAKPRDVDLSAMSNVSQGVDDCGSSSRRARDDLEEQDEEFECAICQDLWLEPTVTTCGHVFCRACLQQYLVHGVPGTRRCPTCRRFLHTTVRKDLAVCRPLAKLLEDRFPEACQRLRANAAASKAPVGDEVETVASAGASEMSAELPIFVLEPTLPRQRLRLYVFEPKYVAMVQTVLQGDGVFGVVGIGDEGDHLHHGVEVAIEECAAHSGGRFRVTCVATRPFKIVQTFMQPAGFLLANVEMLPQDEPGGASPENIEAASRIASRFEEWKTQLGGIIPINVSAAAGNSLGAAPPPEMPSALAFWIAAYINPVAPLGVAPDIRPAILAAATTAERLEVLQDGLERSITHIIQMNTIMARLYQFVPYFVTGFAVLVACLLGHSAED